MTRTPLDLDRGADLQIDAPRVPEPLQPLIALAARWAFDGDQSSSLLAPILAKGCDFKEGARTGDATENLGDG
jgi:hypothetical protein